MSNWKSDYKNFQGNWEKIGFMTESQALRLESLSNDMDGYASLETVQLETIRAITAETEIKNALDGYGATYIDSDGYINLDGYASKISLQNEVNRATEAEQFIRDGYSSNTALQNEVNRATAEENRIKNALDGYASNAASYSDIFGNIDQAAANGALTLEAYRDTPVLKYWFRRDQDDTIYLSFQMPHYWDLSAVEPHLHVIGTSPTTGNVRATGRYTWSRLNHLAIPVWASWTQFSITKEILNTDQWMPTAISLGLITPPAAAQGPSAFLHIQLTRPGSSDALDTYDGSKPDHTATANLMLEGFDVHVKMNTFGTVGLYS